MKILVCEDDTMLIKTLEFRLKRDGYQVETASDGKQATQILKKEDPDLIITDLLMPYVSGLEITNFVRNELQKETPIILLSKVGQEEIVLKAFELGADDYITKPFSPNELSIRIKKLLLKK